MHKSEPIELGDDARDDISGFAGCVTAITTWLNGCRRITLSPRQLRDGKPIEGHTFDIEQLVLVKKNGRAPTAATGGDRPDVGARPGTPSR